MKRSRTFKPFILPLLLLAVLLLIPSKTGRAETLTTEPPGWVFVDKTNTLYILDDRAFNKRPDMESGYKYFGGCAWSEVKGEITTIVVCEGIKTLPNAVFADSVNLERVLLPDTLETIEEYVFYNCSALKEITIPDSVETIGRETFFQCKSLQKITLGKNVKMLGDNLFAECPSLETIVISPEQPYFCIRDGILYNKDRTTLVLCPAQKKGNPVLPDSLQKIGIHAFANCQGITKITIPEKVEMIEGGAFYNCRNLKKIVFAKNSKCKTIIDFVRCLGDDIDEIYGVFEDCTALEKLSFPDSLEILGGYAIENCSSLQSVSLGSSFKTLKCGVCLDERGNNFGYQGLSSLAKVTVSSNNKTYSAADGVLYNKKKTTLYWYPENKEDKNFTLPKTVKQIKKYAFRGNKNLQSMNLTNCEKIEIGAFRNSLSLKKVVMGNKLKEIEYDAFRECKKLKTVDWSKKLKKIGDGAFRECKSLKKFVSYGNQTVIEDWGFYKCSSLDTVILKEGTLFIGAYGFANCPKLKKVTVPSSVKKVDDVAFGYKQTNGPKRVKEFVLYCKKNTGAYKYAKSGVSSINLSKQKIVCT